MTKTKWYSLRFVGGSSKCIDIARALKVDADLLNSGDVVAAAIKVLTCEHCGRVRYSLDIQGVLKKDSPAATALGELPTLVIEGTSSRCIGENQYTLKTWSGAATPVVGVGQEYVVLRNTPGIPGGEVYYQGNTLTGILIPYQSGSLEEEESKLEVIEGECICPLCR